MSWWWRPGPGPGTPQAESPLQNPASLAGTAVSPPPVSLGQVQVQHPISIKVGILLDGDADYFTRTYTSKGRVGGELAAMELKNKVEHFIRKEKSVPPQVRIDMVAYSFLNVRGLSNFLGDDIREFAHGFNSSPWAFSMLDVGESSQSADSAIKSHLPFLLSSCDHVLFGGSHDNGYHDILSSLSGTELQSKIILLRTTPYCAKKILMLGLYEAHFPMLFEGRDPTERSRSSKGNASSSVPPSKGEVIANVSYATVASLDAPVPPAVTSSQNSTTSTSLAKPSQYDFKPLLRLLLSRLSLRHESRPLRGNLAYELKLLPNPPIDISVRGNFKQYTAEAASRGLVRLGVGNTVGSEWIELGIPISAAKKLVTEVPKTLPQASAPQQSIKQKIAKTTPSEFQVLVEVLRSFPDGLSNFTMVGSKMAERGSKLWGQGKGSFAEYAERAVTAGIVKTQPIKGRVGEFWIKLRSRYLGSSPALALRQPSDRFIPLLRFIRDGEHLEPLCSKVVGELLKLQPPHFARGEWSAYLREAQELGLVRTGSRGLGQEWVEIADGVDVSKL
ncbi:hypothetical protein JCM5353_002494 [Sporobolomyces roseus]